MYLTYKYKIYPSKSLSHWLSDLHEEVCKVHNYLRYITKKTWNDKRKFLSKKALYDLTKGYSKCDNVQIHSQVVQEVVDEFYKCYKKTPLRLRYKDFNKKLIWIPLKNQNFKLTDSSDKFQQIQILGKHIKFNKHREFEGKIASGSISQETNGTFYVNIVIESLDGTQSVPSNDDIGIDPGIKAIGTCSNGYKIENNLFYRNAQKILAKVQSKAKRDNKESLRKKLRKLHLKVRRQRLDFLHKEANNIISFNPQNIYIGHGLEGKWLTRGNLAKSRYDTGYGIFKNLLTYKCEHAGVNLYIVNEKKSTLTCNSCRSETGPRGKSGLKVREWTCSTCGTRHDRDINASINILRFGQESISKRKILFEGSPALKGGELSRSHDEAVTKKKEASRKRAARVRKLKQDEEYSTYLMLKDKFKDLP